MILNCDGVLVDSERLAVRVDSVALAELGWTLTEAEIVERFLGRTEGEMMAAAEAHRVERYLQPGGPRCRRDTTGPSGVRKR